MFSNKYAHKIAVVGIACRFPKSDGLDVFWQHLVNKDCMISEAPKNRWDWRLHKINEKSYCRWGGFIDCIDEFDANFFNISPREARLLDPQQRICMELAWQVIEHAGHAPSQLRQSQTGVFTGVTLSDYYEQQRMHGVNIDAFTYGGYVHSIISNRISYWFDLKGPSLSVDTACASSFTALNTAINSIKAGQCDRAIVLAVNALISPSIYTSFAKSGILTPEKHCHSFTNKAEGFIRSEGGGAVFLKRLDQAIKDNDHIYGIIESVGELHSGHTSSMPTPDPDMQVRLIKETLKKAGKSIGDINYVECHGTSTKVGDKAEFQGLKRVFSEAAGNCHLGTLKTSMGHLESAAGMASLIKVLLSLHHNYIPANYSECSKDEYLDTEGHFSYLHQPYEWKDCGRRTAGINAYGFGGVITHCIVSDSGVPSRKLNLKRENHLFVFSAKTQDSLKMCLKSYLAFFENHQMVDDEIEFMHRLAMTLQIGREQFDCRYATMAEKLSELIALIKSFLMGGSLKVSCSKYSEKTLRLWCQEKKYEQLQQAWLSGQMINWSLIKRPRGLKRIGLPVYGFDRQSYWFSETPNTEQVTMNYTLEWKKQSTPTQPLELKNSIVLLPNSLNSMNEAVKEWAGNSANIVSDLKAISLSDALPTLVIDFFDYADSEVELWLRVHFLKTLIIYSKQKITYIHVHKGASEFSGFSETLAAEYKHLFITSLQVMPNISVDELLSSIMQELRQFEFANRVRYISGERYCPYLLEHTLDISSRPNTIGRYLIRSDAVYLITGATGGLGQALIKALYDKGARHFLLCSKQPLPPVSSWKRICEVDESLQKRVGKLLSILKDDISIDIFSGSLSDSSFPEYIADAAKKYNGQVFFIVQVAQLKVQRRLLKRHRMI